MVDDECICSREDELGRVTGSFSKKSAAEGACCPDDGAGSIFNDDDKDKVEIKECDLETVDEEEAEDEDVKEEEFLAASRTQVGQSGAIVVCASRRRQS